MYIHTQYKDEHKRTWASLRPGSIGMEVGEDYYYCPLECVRVPVSHWEWGAGLAGWLRVLGVVSAVATSHTGPSVKPSRGRLVALSVGCGSSWGSGGACTAAARLA